MRPVAKFSRWKRMTYSRASLIRYLGKVATLFTYWRWFIKLQLINLYLTAISPVWQPTLGNNRLARSVRLVAKLSQLIYVIFLNHFSACGNDLPLAKYCAFLCAFLTCATLSTFVKEIMRFRTHCDDKTFCFEIRHVHLAQSDIWFVKYRVKQSRLRK